MDSLVLPSSAHFLDEYDRTLSAAAADSRERFLKLLGPLRQYLERDDVYNVNVNEGDQGRIFVEAMGGKFEAPETMSRDARESLIGHIAVKRGGVINALNARLEADMPHGFDVRVQAFCPPISDFPIMLRRHAARVIPMDTYRAAGAAAVRSVEKPPCSARGLDAWRAAIARGDNIVVAGAVNSGKTTALSAGLAEAARVRPDARLLVIQDRRELKPSHRDCIQVLARVEQARFESGGRIDRYVWDFPDALESALRTGFSLLAWGELRDPRSAVALLMALNTGSRGLMTTLHAVSALDALYRLEDLLRAGNALPLRKMIVRFVDLIVFMQLQEDGSRRVGDIQRVLDVDDEGEYVMESVL